MLSSILKFVIFRKDRMWTLNLILLSFVGASIQAPVSHIDLFWFQDCGRSIYPDAGVPQSRTKRSASQMIVNGFDARNGEFPWQASLRRRGSHMCGAVIINPTWLLTAAHCTEGERPDRLTIVVGDHIRSASNANRQTFNVRRFINHPKYDESGEIENDISVMEITGFMLFNDYIQPACKPTGNYGSKPGVTSGWGRVGDFLPLADQLQFANNPIMTDGDCNACFPRQNDILPGMLCFGFCGENVQSTCNGDSGGPMVVKNNDKFEVVGLTSWGMGGCLSRYPPVFTNVSFFSDWVDENINSAIEIEQIQLY